MCNRWQSYHCIFILSYKVKLATVNADDSYSISRGTNDLFFYQVISPECTDFLNLRIQSVEFVFIGSTFFDENKRTKIILIRKH